MKNKKMIDLLYIFFAMLVIVGLTACKKNNRPEGSWIASHVPDELLQYRLAGEDDGISNVTDVEIINQLSNEEICYTDCVLTLEDERFKRTIYYHLETQKMDHNEWYILNWNEYQEPKVYIKEEFGKQSVQKYLDRVGVEVSNGEYVYDEQTEKITTRFSLDEDYEYVKINGTLEYSGILTYNPEKYPHYFDLYEGLDASNVNTEWKLDGTWVGESDSYRVEVSFESEGDNQYYYYGRAYYINIYGDEDYYEQEGNIECDSNALVKSDFSGVSVVNPEDINLFLYVNISYPAFGLHFYKDSAGIASPTGISHFSDENAFVRQGENSVSIGGEKTTKEDNDNFDEYNIELYGGRAYEYINSSIGYGMAIPVTFSRDTTNSDENGIAIFTDENGAFMTVAGMYNTDSVTPKSSVKKYNNLEYQYVGDDYYCLSFYSYDNIVYEVYHVDDEVMYGFTIEYSQALRDEYDSLIEMMLDYIANDSGNL